MKRNSLLLLLLVLAGIAIVSIASLTWLRETFARFSQAPALAVKAERVSRGTIERVLQFSGAIEPVKETDVLARIAGIVKEIHPKAGDSVSQGMLVAIIDPRDLLQRIAAVEASFSAARSDLQEKQHQLAEAEKQLEKTRELLKQDFIARRELAPAQVRADTARAEAELAKAQAAQQEALLVQSRKLLSLRRVTAPFSGVVMRRLVEPGSRVGDGTAILTLAAMDMMKVMLRIPAEDFDLVQDGMAAQLRIEGSPVSVLEGKIVRSSSETEPSRQTLTAEIHVPNRQGTLKPGMDVSVTLNLGSQDVLLVPASAVIAAADKDYVYTLADGRTQRRSVIKGRVKNGQVVIRSGLNEGEWVVVDVQESLKTDNRARVLGN